jgi:hypothetical protein
MSRRQVVGMHMPHRSARAERARAELGRALPDAEVGEPDSTGTFEIAVDAADREAALERVWNAVATAGADEHIVFAEHSDLPEHWRIRR